MRCRSILPLRLNKKIVPQMNQLPPEEHVESEPNGLLKLFRWMFPPPEAPIPSGYSHAGSSRSGGSACVGDGEGSIASSHHSGATVCDVISSRVVFCRFYLCPFAVPLASCGCVSWLNAGENKPAGVELNRWCKPMRAPILRSDAGSRCKSTGACRHGIGTAIIELSL